MSCTAFTLRARFACFAVTALTVAPAQNAWDVGHQRSRPPVSQQVYAVRGMSVLTLRVNSRAQTVDVDPETPLLYVLSDDLELRGPKFGCGLGQCGACTIIADGRAIRSCVTPVSTVAQAAITTLEGLGTANSPHPIQQAFIDEQAAQCGFCLSGVILTAKAFLDGNPRATDTQIQQALSGVLCRCFASVRMLKALRRYADGAAR